MGIIGSGSSSMITVAAGGMLAPGNSIGTLTINGNLVLESGSIYNVETDPLSTDSDRVKVSGDATINGGTVAHIGFAGDYALNTKYTILQADGELSGSFGNVTSEFAFLNPTLLYDYSAGSVQLELPRNDVQFISKGTTPNHLAVANALDSMGTNSKVYNAFVKLPDDKTVIGNALDSLSGEIYGSTTSALIEESHYVRDIVNNRMRFALGGIVMSDAMSSQQIDQTWNAWAQAYGGWNKIGGNSNYADVKHSTGGFMVGVDTIVENGWLVGAFAGYSNSTIKADARASSASVDSFHIGAYVNGGVKPATGRSKSRPPWRAPETAGRA
ncbi:autotransporter outer membrane beta-barrel domain-containing protein [Ochrobactrum oryzae]|nr:autotransporter outer membrane beta-barrel domain-containing protein [Brucella oryzae]